MVTLCSSQAVIDQLDSTASATAIASEAIINRFIERAEKVVVSETNIDWISGFASVDSNVAGELATCVASHAAKLITLKDLQKFGTRATGITLVNGQIEEFQRSLKALKDLDTQSPRSVQS